jgi:Ca-activated chloride channel family protein
MKSFSKPRFRFAATTLLVPLCLTAILLLPESSSFLTIVRAQKQTRRRTPVTPRSKPVVQPAPRSTPTPTILDELGEPPPPPVLPSKQQQDINPGDVISISTTEVMLPVTVRDEAGRLVTALTRNDFRVFEDGREQPLSDLALRQVPVDVLLMVDASSSVATNLDDFRRAAEGFARRLASDDRLSLIKFDDRVELLLDWTKSRFQLHRALGRLEPGMFTRFNDALMLASRDQFGPSSSRRAIIVLTDGIDSGRGNTTIEAALQSLLKAQVSVYVVSNTEISRATKRSELDQLMSGSEAVVRFNQLRIDDLREGLRVLDRSEETLEQLAAATGGRLYKPNSFTDLESTYAEVAEELRRQFAIYYMPLNKARDGSFRRVRVETTRPSNKATTRIGYFAPRSS